MRYYRRIIQAALVGFLLGGGLFFWGYKNDGVIRIIFGVLIIGITIKEIIVGVKYVQEFKLWKAKNRNTLIFFYATKKSVQAQIEKTILPMLPGDCMKVYYDGPVLIGDIKRSVIIELMNQYKGIKIHSPSIFKIVDDQIHLEYLSELNDFNAEKIDLETIKGKIEKVVNA